MATGSKHATGATAVALPSARVTRAQANDQQRFSLTTKTATNGGKRSVSFAQKNDQSSVTEAPAGEIVLVRSTSQSSNLSAKCPDPLALRQHKRRDVSEQKLREDYPKANNRKLKRFYTRQNELIDQYLQSGDEERLRALNRDVNGPKIKLVTYASSGVNVCLFAIQLYAAISTGSLSLFATATDAFLAMASSIVILTTVWMASRPSVYKYPIGRTRIETIGIILFCALMTTVAVQLIVESGHVLARGERASKPLKTAPLVCVGIALFFKSCLMMYCFLLRRFPACHVLFINHRNDIIVASFGLVMSIVGTRVEWYVDPLGAICIGLLILFSWVSQAFAQVWLLVGKTASREFISKVIYLTVTHDEQILKVDTCRTYHAGKKYYVEVDIIMDEKISLKISHDISQALHRKIEELEDVERAFVHVDYEHNHDPHEEHKPLSSQEKEQSRSLRQVMADTKKRVRWSAKVSTEETIDEVT